MRIFALSDVHVDYDANARWLSELSSVDYQKDVLILAGDISDSLRLLEWTLTTLVRRFRQVMFVPGNHELWVCRDKTPGTSLDKFELVCRVAEQSGASMQRFSHDGVSISPLLGWYDYSFGLPSDELRDIWMDFYACRWPADFEVHDVAAHFTSLNRAAAQDEGVLITFSHFLPRIDVMPGYIPGHARMLYPILGSNTLDAQIRQLKSTIHVYGHSHVNRQVVIDGVTYVNNAFGYPRETLITSKQLLCIYGS